MCFSFFFQHCMASDALGPALRAPHRASISPFQAGPERRLTLAPKRVSMIFDFSTEALKHNVIASLFVLRFARPSSSSGDVRFVKMSALRSCRVLGNFRCESCVRDCATEGLSRQEVNLIRIRIMPGRRPRRTARFGGCVARTAGSQWR